MRMAWVLTDNFSGLATRIFRNRRAMQDFFSESNDASVIFMDRGLAVSQIRRQVFQRQEGRCVRCPNLVTYSGAHLHERIFRGEGGEISLDNSEILCADCHIGERGVHGNRRPQFTK